MSLTRPVRPEPVEGRAWSCLAFVGLALLALVSLESCGKKGPPLAPFSSSPAAPSEVTVRRKGDQVEIHFKVPVANSDGRRPAKIDHVAVYALTMAGEKVEGGSDEGRESQGGQGAKGAAGGHRSGRARGASAGTSAAPGPGHELPIRKYGTVVGRVLVRKPPPKPKEPKDDEPPPPPPPPRTDPGLDQGDAAVIIDTLTPSSLTPAEISGKDRGGPSHPHEGDHDHDTDARPETGRNAYRALLTPPELGPPLPRQAMRYYSLAGTNGKKKGVFAPPIAVPLEDLPPAPPAPVVTVAEGHIQLALAMPSEGLRRGVLPPAPSPFVPASTTAAASDAAVAGTPADQSATPPCTPAPATTATSSSALPGASAPPCVPPPTTLLPAKLIFTYPSPTYAFMVYDMAPPGFTPPKQEPGAVPPYPALLTPAPVQAAWDDPRFVVGADRCYSVRIVMAIGEITTESAASPTVCVKTVDTFPPAAPKNLQAVASEGTISLIWDANTEADLAGYIVLRGVAGSDKLAAITPTPIKETTFRDTNVRAGVRYAYVVVAVDTATPQNVSAQSNRVEETAR